MKRTTTAKFGLIIIALLALANNGCGRAEWGRAYLSGHKYDIEFKMPKPFKQTERQLSLAMGYTPWETSYAAEIDSTHSMQIRMMRLTWAQMERMGLNRQSLLELGRNAEVTSAARVTHEEQFKDPEWPAGMGPAKEITFQSPDGQTTTYLKLVIASRDGESAYVVLKAVTPKGEARPSDVDKFFASFKILEAKESDDDATPTPTPEDDHE